MRWDKWLQGLGMAIITGLSQSAVIVYFSDGVLTKGEIFSILIVSAGLGLAWIKEHPPISDPDAPVVKLPFGKGNQ